MKKMRSLRPSLAAFLLMMAMGVATSALSFFVSPVCDDLCFSRGSFTLYYSLMTMAGAFSTSFLGQYINRKGVRGIMLVSSIWVFTGLMLFSLAGSLWMFYAAALATGLFASSCVNLCANVIVQQTYSSEQASSILGFVMAGSGVGGMILSLIVPGFIESFGWRAGYRFLAVCWLVLVFSAFLLFGKTALSSGVGQRKTPTDGMTRAEALRSPKLYLLMAAILIFALSCGIQQHLPSLLSGMGFTTSQVSTLVSLMTASLAVGKVFQGLLYSKIGIEKGGTIMVVLFSVSLLLLMVKSLVYPALILLAFGMGVVTTLMPMVTRFTFGAREYAAIWSLLATASSVGSFIGSPAWGTSYDIAGSYRTAQILCAILLILGLAAMSAAFRLGKSKK